MRYSQMLIPTVKEVPAEAEIASHRLMIRAGFIRKLTSGTYTYLPLGWRSLLKIIEIVRQEMNLAGAQEILMPALQPLELWQKTGRDIDFKDTMYRFADHSGRENVIAPTAEEVVTSLVAGEVSSYKQLPLNLYQISTKYRDEVRPRFGVIRSREFIMKDAYSFDVNEAGLDRAYQKMYQAYRRIMLRCGLRCIAVEAESGPIGGSASQEFMFLCSAGEDVIVHTDDFSYAANIEKAQVDPPAPAERKPGQLPPIEQVHTPSARTIDEVCAFLGTKPQQMIKTLIYSSPAGAVVALVRGDHEANHAKLTHAAGLEGLELAGESLIQSLTGAAVGFAGPIGLAEKSARFIVDHSVSAMEPGVTGANRTDYHVRNVVPGRDFSLAGPNVVVADVRNAVDGDTHDRKPLRFSRGIEIGHVFKLGTKYSQRLDACYLDDKGVKRPAVMGTYGLGINRVLAAAIENGYDDDGCILPISIAPFEAVVVPLNQDKGPVINSAERIYNELKDAGVDVLIDDRSARPGVKFKDIDLIGIPLRIVVGERGLKDGKVEIKLRDQPQPVLVGLEQAAKQAVETIRQMKETLLQRAQEDSPACGGCGTSCKAQNQADRPADDQPTKR